MGLSKSLKRIAAGVTTGGLSEVVGYKGGNPFDLLKPSQTTVDQVPLETPEQRRARIALLNFGETGKYRDINLGDSYTGPLGDFAMTDAEKAGEGRLASFVNAARPEIFDAGEKTLNDLLTGSRFDPNDPNGEYAAFRTQTQRELKDATTATKRNLAFSGNLYSTDTGRQLSDLNARGQEALTSKLAELSDKYVSRRLSAIPMAADLAARKQQLDLMPIAAAYNYGGKSRELRDTEAKTKLAEWIRSRQEKLSGIDALSTVAGKDTPFGVPSQTVSTPSPWMELLLAGTQGAARGLAAG